MTTEAVVPEVEDKSVTDQYMELVEQFNAHSRAVVDHIQGMHDTASAALKLSEQIRGKLDQADKMIGMRLSNVRSLLPPAKEAAPVEG